VKKYMPNFDPRSRFGLKWKPFVLMLEEVGYCSVSIDPKTKSDQVQFSTSFLASQRG